MRNRHSNGTPIITFLTRRSTVKGMIVVSVIVAYGLVYPFLDSAGILYTIPVLLAAWFFGWPAGLIVAFLFFPLNLVIVRTLTEKESIEWIKDGGCTGRHSPCINGGRGRVASGPEVKSFASYRRPTQVQRGSRSLRWTPKFGQKAKRESRS